MSRLADGAIKGFLYQFHKTIQVVLASEDDEIITVEGIVEDIDIDVEDGVKTAIQCKYHEGVAAYVPSLIFRPVLLMAEHYSKNPAANIIYRIFIHVPTAAHELRGLLVGELEAALATTDAKLLKIIGRIVPDFDRTDFLLRAHIEFGPSMPELERIVKDQLAAIGIQGADVDGLLYPNAIQRIAVAATKADEAKRKITRAAFIHDLKAANQTAITYWTLSLRDRAKLLLMKRNQLKLNLQQNSRDRRFYFDPALIDDFWDGIVNFIGDYLFKYHSKRVHIKTPVFAIDASRDEVAALEARLFSKGICVANGVVGDVVDQGYFYREPLKKNIFIGEMKREFEIRLVPSREEMDLLSKRVGDELFVVANYVPIELNLLDTNVSLIGACDFNELAYMLGMRATYE